MTLDIQGQKMRIRFFHQQGAEFYWRQDGTSIPVRGMTTCTVEGPVANEFTEGTAWCSEHDVFNKERGRKVSLTKALSPFSREVRREVWKQYFARKEPKNAGEA